MPIKDSVRRSIDIAKIDASNRLRPLRQDWVDIFAETIRSGEPLPPIEVVERGDRTFRLITGAHRLAAHAQAGLTMVLADVVDAAAYADDAACRLREIKENMCRAGLTVLDRAVAIAEWKRIYEATQNVQKRGGDRRSDQTADSAVWFVESFSKASARALDISERSVQVAVAIATGLAADIREMIAADPIADRQSELMALAREAPERQWKIIDLLKADPPQAGSVAEAIAVLDKTPQAKPAPWEKVSVTFSRLPPRDQTRFFETHQDAIALWIAQRGAAPQVKA
ncbi:MAG: ParB N-terminal domain-containing protein [Methylacidiphilales bacterium]|nr:ParB N-terminal domain-containing protein [Candidatus Methylacidiphilales bacterium]